VENRFQSLPFKRNLQRYTALHPAGTYHGVAAVVVGVGLSQPPHGVAAQVALESKGLKPGYHILSGSRVETRRFQAMGKLDSTSELVQPPDHGHEVHPRVVLLQRLLRRVDDSVGHGDGA
jgi:hypothetical protein